MELVDLVCVDAIRIDLDADTKPGAIRRIITALADADVLGQAAGDELAEAVLKREELGTTGVGRGVAIPHARHNDIETPVCTFAIFHDGIDFDSLDGEKVDIVFLLLSSPDRPDEHLSILQQVSVLFQDELTLNFLRQAKTPTAIMEVLEEVRQKQLAV